MWFRSLDHVPASLWGKVALVVSPLGWSMDELSALVPPDRAKTFIDSDSHTYLFVTERTWTDVLTVYDTPQRGSRDCEPSPVSDALYHARFSLPNFGILVQELPKRPRGFGQTTAHCHTFQREWWGVLSGSGKLLMRDHREPGALWRVERNLSPGMIVQAEPYYEHQLVTTNPDGMRTCLVMKDHPQGIHHDDHYFVPPAPVELIIA